MNFVLREDQRKIELEAANKKDIKIATKELKKQHKIVRVIDSVGNRHPTHMTEPFTVYRRIIIYQLEVSHEKEM